MLDVSQNVVDKRYSRALQRLRRDLSQSVFDELLDE
jgi:DNA-directed RNA polymerase specialized sigma24 family protein